ncbi:MAG: response regulator [Chloroflexi bacterium]|nr:response regulator [Chloroflexota bacterium]
MATVLVVEDDRSMLTLLKSALEQEGYRVVAAGSVAGALAALRQESPDLAILDVNLPDGTGYDLAERLRARPVPAYLPVILLTANVAADDRRRGLRAGADDYVTKPFDLEELLLRVQTQLRHVEQGLRSELTGLPGNVQIERVLRRLVAQAPRPWVVLYADLDNFKAYNDAYGFLAGNRLIRAAARVLEDTLRAHAHSPEIDFLGHIGGDDFVVVTAAEQADAMCRAIIRRFDAEVAGFYNPADRRRGGIEVVDRQGQLRRFPFVSISIAGVTNLYRPIEHHYLISSIAAELKRKVKSQPGSACLIDRRRSPTDQLPVPIDQASGPSARTG